MGQVEGRNAQRPEAAEHGEDAEPQVVPRGHHEEVVLTLCVTGVVALQRQGEDGREFSEGVTESHLTGAGPAWLLLWLLLLMFFLP